MMNALLSALRHFPRYQFLVEYLLCLIPMVVRLPRRRMFPLRLVAVLAGSFLVSSVWNRELASMLPVYILRYLLLFGCGVGLAVVCFSCSGWTALYCGSAAYAIQHIFNRCFAIASTFLHLEAGMVSYVAVYLLLLGAALLALFFAFTRQITPQTCRYMANPRNLGISGLILLCVVVLSSLQRASAADTPVLMATVCSLYDIIGCLSALIILHNIFRMDELKQENAIIQEMWNQDRKQLALSQETMQLLNIKCHDMRHLLGLMNAQQEKSVSREINSIRELIDVYDSRVDTGNEILNLLLAEKGLICQKEQIRLNCVADGAKLALMEKTDLYSLFGNALDNAIEAVRFVAQPEQRIITLTVTGAMDMVSICVENYYRGQIRLEDGLPITTKGSTDYHGYGVRSMRCLVEKYHGELTIHTDDNIFSLLMLLPCAQK